MAGIQKPSFGNNQSDHRKHAVIRRQWRAHYRNHESRIRWQLPAFANNGEKQRERERERAIHNHVTGERYSRVDIKYYGKSG